jgi:hypothetical protein
MEDQLVTVDSGMSAVAMMSDEAMFNRMVRFADLMATGRATIPKELQNPGDCMAITMQAMNWKMNPFSVAQKVHFISGKIGYESQLVAAAVENSGAIVGGFHFEWFGPWEKVVGKFEIKTNADKKEFRVPGWALKDEEGIGIKVWATKKGESEPRYLDLLLAQARTPQEAEVYSNEEFAEKKPDWKATVIEKKKDNARFIAFIESKGKKFTDAQKAEIMAWKAIEQPAEPNPQPQQPQGGEVKDDFVDALNAAEAKQGENHANS